LQDSSGDLFNVPLATSNRVHATPPVWPRSVPLPFLFPKL